MRKKTNLNLFVIQGNCEASKYIVHQVKEKIYNFF